MVVIKKRNVNNNGSLDPNGGRIPKMESTEAVQARMFLRMESDRREARDDSAVGVHSRLTPSKFP